LMRLISQIYAPHFHPYIPRQPQTLDPGQSLGER
jgi:hypothetical protein